MLRALKRWAALGAAAAYLLQGMVLLPLHETIEAEPHDGCGACVAPAPAEESSSAPAHNHPIHDQHHCGICAAAHLSVVAAAPVPPPVFSFEIFRLSLAPVPGVQPGDVKLPASRGPPSQPV